MSSSNTYRPNLNYNDDFFRTTTRNREPGSMGEQFSSSTGRPVDPEARNIANLAQLREEVQNNLRTPTFGPNNPNIPNANNNNLPNIEPIEIMTNLLLSAHNTNYINNRSANP